MMEKKATSDLSAVRIRNRLAKKLGNPAFRRRFFRLRAQEEVAQQILELRERRQFRQKDLARAAKMKQSAISRIEKAGYSAWTYKTLLRIAEALDAQLRIVFEPQEDVIARYEREENEQFQDRPHPQAANSSHPPGDVSRALNGQAGSHIQIRSRRTSTLRKPH
jgi:transcriptional regulator with XRE-family HTH domain